MFEVAPYILLGFLFAGLLNEFVKPRASRASSVGAWPASSDKSCRSRRTAAAVFIVVCSRRRCRCAPARVQPCGFHFVSSGLSPRPVSTPVPPLIRCLDCRFALMRPIAAHGRRLAGGWAVDRFGGEACITRRRGIGAPIYAAMMVEGGCRCRGVCSRAVSYGFVVIWWEA